MKRRVSFSIVLVVALGLGMAQQPAPKPTSASEAIEAISSMQTVAEKTSYLVARAKEFYASEQFQQTVDVAQYILRYLDKDSQDAKSLLDMAKDALAQKAQSTVNDLKSKIPGFGQ